MAEEQKHSDFASVSPEMAAQEQAALGRRRPTNTPADDRMWQASIREEKEAMAFERERMGYARELAELRERTQQQIAAMETQLAQAVTLASNPWAPTIAPPALVAPEIPTGTIGLGRGRVDARSPAVASVAGRLVAPRVPS